VVWSTGGVGSNAVDAIRRRPDLDLVGVWVHSDEKVGKDAGELAGGDPIGVAATNDADALIALKPDCVVYAASGPERDAGAVPDYLRLLEAGINVVSTSSTSLVFPPAYYSPEWRDQLQAAEWRGDFYRLERKVLDRRPVDHDRIMQEIGCRIISHRVHRYYIRGILQDTHR